MSRRFRSSRHRGLLGLMVFGLALATARPGLVADPVTEALGVKVRELFSRCGTAVVKIESTDRHGHLSGTGFLIDPNGLIYTSYSVGGASENLVVKMGERKYPATRILGDSRSGIALLKIETETPFLPLANSRTLDVADPVVAIGYPLDLPLTPSFGVVGGFDLKHMGRYFATTHIRANLPVQRGQGGAPLLNLEGRVVGILISRLDGGAGCYVLPIEAAEKVRRDYIRFGELRPGWLGIDVGEAEIPVKGSVALIKDFVSRAPAADSKLRRGDTLLRVGDVPIDAPEDVLDAAFFLTAGDTVPIVISREGREISVTVSAGEVRPVSDDPLRQPALPTAQAGGMQLETE